MTFVTYDEDAKIKMHIYATPLSVVAIVFIAIGGLVGLICLICVTINIIAWCQE